MIINLSPPSNKTENEAISQSVSLFSRFSTVLLLLLLPFVPLYAVRVCTSLLIHEYLSTAMTNLFITPTAKLWPSLDDNIIVGEIYGNSHEPDNMMR